MKKIKMFKPGKHVAVNGKTYDFSEEQLKASAAAYNPELHAAPLVIGHPTLDAPAYGRITSVEFADGFLLGEPVNVDPAFAEIVNGGRYDRVSLSFYAPDSPANPVPGVLYPRHLGFLGAVPPGCKGLGAVSFAEGEEGIISFGDYEDRVLVRMLRGLKNLFIDKFGKEAADQALDEYDLQSLTEEAMAPARRSGTCSACGMPCADCVCPPSTSSTTSTLDYSEGESTMLTAAQLADKEAELKKREAALTQKENTGKHAANLAFAEGLVKEGKLVAAHQAALVGVLDFCAGVTTGDTIEFGEGDAKKTQAPVEVLMGIFGTAPKVIEFGELASGKEPGKREEQVSNIDLTKYV